MKLVEKVRLARQIAATELESIEFLTVLEVLEEEYGIESEDSELAVEIQSLIQNTLADEVRGE